MLKIHSKFFYRFCTNVVDKITLQPKKVLLSSLLKERPTKDMSKQFKQDYQIPVASEDKDKQLKTSQRQKNYVIPKEQYKKFMDSSPHGRVHIFNYQNTQFTLVGTQFQHIPLKNIYKLLINSKPDLILLQIRPDDILQNFRTFVTRKNDPEKFSSTQYFNLITRDAEVILPSYASAKEVIIELEKDQIELLNIEDLIQDEFSPYQLYERIPTKIVALISLYSQVNGNIPILLGDLPESIFKDKIVNPRTVPQLQKYLIESSRQCALNPDIQPNTPLNLSYFLYPETFLSISDSYITTLIEFIAAKGKHKRVTLFLGQGQSDSIAHILDNKSSSHLEIELQSPLIRGSILKDITCEDLVERHAILDVMKYGQFLNFKMKTSQINLYDYFQTTYNMIQKFADPQKVNKNRVKEMKYLHLELINKYLQIFQNEFKNGQDLLQQEFMKRASLL